MGEPIRRVSPLTIELPSMLAGGGASLALSSERKRSGCKRTSALYLRNGESFLAQALDSLLAQTFHDFEIVISDNASTDRTPEICRAYARRDPRVRYVCNQRNLGAVANFNRVFELSTAPLFKWAAHDDLHLETYLESCIRLLDDDPDVVLAHCESAFIDETGELFPFIHETGSYVDPKTGVI